MARDEFTKETASTLAKRVAFFCSNPDCRAITSGPHSDPNRALNIGVAAHITAASPGGPRFDPSLTAEHRSDGANGIWLCQGCAKMVDSDPLEFGVDLLRAWKVVAEAHARALVQRRATHFTGAIADRIQIGFDAWSVHVERGNLPGDQVIFIPAPSRGDIIFSFRLRLRNTSPHEEQLCRASVQFRAGDEVLIDDSYAVQYEIAIAPNRWVSHDIQHALEANFRSIYQKCDSVWFAAGLLGTDETIEKKIVDLDHSKPLPIW